ncbi:MAG: hypothetical protein ACR2O4_09920 [Hyphomicrobiaceae bacterium]
MRSIVLGLFAVSLWAQTAAAGEAHYACAFDSGASWNFENGKFGSDATAPLTFTIEKINRSSQKAELATKTGRSDLKMVAAIDAMHFIEVTVSGYLNLTTIYGDSGDGSAVPAVHSRHLGIVGQPLGGQMTGFCTKKSS